MPDVQIGDWVHAEYTRTYLSEDVVIPFEGEVGAIEGNLAAVVGDDGEEKWFRVKELEVLWQGV